MATIKKKGQFVPLSEFMKQPCAIASVNNRQTITFEGTRKECFQARKNLIKNNPHLIFKMYEKVYQTNNA
jgi:hypothetical protein